MVENIVVVVVVQQKKDIGRIEARNIERIEGREE